MFVPRRAPYRACAAESIENMDAVAVRAKSEAASKKSTERDILMDQAAYSGRVVHRCVDSSVFRNFSFSSYNVLFTLRVAHAHLRLELSRS